MNITGFRFRNEGALVVLQVSHRPQYAASYVSEKDEWRDAKTEDLVEVAALLATPLPSRQERGWGFE